MTDTTAETKRADLTTTLVMAALDLVEHTKETDFSVLLPCTPLVLTVHAVDDKPQRRATDALPAQTLQWNEGTADALYPDYRISGSLKTSTGMQPPEYYATGHASPEVALPVLAQIPDSLYERVKEQQEAAYLFGDTCKESVRIALDGVLDAMRECDAALAATQPAAAPVDASAPGGIPRPAQSAAEWAKELEAALPDSNADVAPVAGQGERDAKGGMDIEEVIDNLGIRDEVNAIKSERAAISAPLADVKSVACKVCDDEGMVWEGGCTTACTACQDVTDDSAEDTAPVAPKEAQPVERCHTKTWKHAANEWADTAYAALQWLGNIEDVMAAGRPVDVKRARENIERCCQHAKAVADGVYNADKVAASIAPAPQAADLTDDEILSIAMDHGVKIRTGQGAIKFARALLAAPTKPAKQSDALDAARLDWIAEEECSIDTLISQGATRYRVFWPELGEGQTDWHPSARDAIDAAMASQPADDGSQG